MGSPQEVKRKRGPQVRAPQEGGVPSNPNLQGQASQAGTKRRAEEQATPEEGDDDLDMGIPLATEQASSSSRKREIPQEGEPAAPAATRPRLENVEIYDKFEFDVGEIFSPPRVADLANKIGLKGGYSLDKEYMDKMTGKNWDLMKEREQAQLLRCKSAVHPVQLPSEAEKDVDARSRTTRRP